MLSWGMTLPAFSLTHYLGADGAEPVYRAGLFDSEETTSRVQPMVLPDGDRRWAILATWLARTSEGKPVGMAMVSEPEADSFGQPVLNLYVNPAHRSQGLGKALVRAALASYPHLTGFYTFDAAVLYHALGIPPAELRRTRGVERLLAQGAKDAARAAHVTNVLRAMQELNLPGHRPTSRAAERLAQSTPEHPRPVLRKRPAPGI